MLISSDTLFNEPIELHVHVYAKMDDKEHCCLIDLSRTNWPQKHNKLICSTFLVDYLSLLMCHSRLSRPLRVKLTLC